MKINEAEIIAKEKVQVMVEYLEQFLSDDDKIVGRMEYGSDNNLFCVDMFVKKDDKKVFERGYKLGIPSIYSDVFIKELDDMLLDKFLTSETMGISDYARIKGSPGMNRNGFYVFNDHGSKINIEFSCYHELFDEIMREHNKRINEYRNSVGSIIL